MQSADQFIVEDLNDAVVHDSGKKIQHNHSINCQCRWIGVRVINGKYEFGINSMVPANTHSCIFLPNRAPNATDLQPGSNDVNDPMGAGLAPEFTWTFEDLDLEAQTAYQVKLFNTSDVLIPIIHLVFKRNKARCSAGSLTEGRSMQVTVWDPNGLSNTTEKAYIRTNATPSSPYIKQVLIDNYRNRLLAFFIRHCW